MHQFACIQNDALGIVFECTDDDCDRLVHVSNLDDEITVIRPGQVRVPHAGATPGFALGTA